MVSWADPVRYAAQLGYEVTVVKDASADYSDKEMHALIRYARRVQLAGGQNEINISGSCSPSKVHRGSGPGRLAADYSADSRFFIRRARYVARGHQGHI
jgi:hypothetical protein